MPELVTHEGDKYKAIRCSVDELEKGDLVCFNLHLTAMAAWRVIASLEERTSHDGRISLNLRYEGSETDAITTFQTSQPILRMVLTTD